MATLTTICPEFHVVFYIIGDHIEGPVKCLKCGREVVPQLRGQAVPNEVVDVGDDR